MLKCKLSLLAASRIQSEMLPEVNSWGGISVFIRKVYIVKMQNVGCKCRMLDPWLGYNSGSSSVVEQWWQDTGTSLYPIYLPSSPSSADVVLCLMPLA